MLEYDFPFINEEFFSENIPASEHEVLLAAGWRHFGPHFFRYSYGIHELDIRSVIPLRIRLADFSFSKSQRRLLRRNSDLSVSVSPVNITPEKESLFDRHKQRFTFGIPDTIYDFVPGGPASTPCGEVEISVYSEQRLVAASYFDIAEQSVSSIYAMFEPSESSRGLGIFTLLKEIETALELGKEFLYLGYCYEGKSFYDYKKRFRGTEMYNWRGTWRKSDLKV